jgi:DNA end-binding protein Ku
MAQTTKSVTRLEIGEEGSAFAIPVSLKKIRSATDVQLDTATKFGEPVGEKKVEARTGKLLEEVDLPLQKGVFRSKPNKSKRETWSDFAPIKPEDLDTIQDATNIETFVIESFIPLAQVPMERVTEAYFLAPADGMPTKTLVLFARALKRKKAAGVFKMVKTSRQHLAVVYEKNGGLIVNTLAFSSEFGSVLEAAEALARDDVKISKAEQDMAETLIEAYSGDADILDTFEDDLIPLKADLIERALMGKSLPARKTRAAAAVADDDLEARLRATLDKASPPVKAAA